MSQSIFNNDDEVNPSTNPFYYAQDLTSYYDGAQEQRSKNFEKCTEQTKTKKLQMKRKCTLSLSSPTTMHIIRSISLKPGQKLIKIQIYDIADPDNCDYSNSDNANVNVQYVVEANNNYDVILDATNTLIRDMSKKLNEI